MFFQERINFEGISHWYFSMHPHILATVHSQTRFLFQQRNIAIAYMAGDVATHNFCLKLGLELITSTIMYKQQPFHQWLLS